MPPTGDAELRLDVIPLHRTYFMRSEGSLCPSPFASGHGPIDYSSVAVFLATGLFVGDCTWLRDVGVLPPGSSVSVRGGRICKVSQRWRWSSYDGERTLDDCVEEFSSVLEESVRVAAGDRKQILALSGGLDSRTLAVAVSRLRLEASGYTYGFPGGPAEAEYGMEIAKIIDIPFRQYSIPQGYLWQRIEDLAHLNSCESDFVSPRQMAFIDELEGLGEQFLLGHWGDVLFSSFQPQQEAKTTDIVSRLEKMLLKPGGMELGSAMWRHCGLEGDLREYLRSQIEILLRGIELENTSARIRAFKSTTWAPRWTSVNLNVFARHRALSVPYYTEEMCRFVSGVPERFLTSRLIQRTYIQRYAPRLAQLPWQPYAPFSVDNWERYYSPAGRAVRAYRSLARRVNSLVTGKPFIQRNWELQFLGEKNLKELGRRLDSSSLEAILPRTEIAKLFSAFRARPERSTAHACSMLLVASLFLDRMGVASGGR